MLVCIVLSELTEQFRDLLTRYKDAVDKAKKNLDLQTSRRLSDTE